MTKAKISEYDATAANNTDANGVNIAEGCAPSGINNAIREVMAALKRFETGSDGDSVTVGGNLVVSGSTSVNTFNVDVISEKTSAAGVTVDGVLLKDSQVSTDQINEKTSAAGVTIDGVLLKDSEVTTDVIKEKTSATGVTVDSVLLKDGLVGIGADGSASAPSIYRASDTNTGIYFPAADNIGFATGGTIRGRWTTDGLCFGSDTAAANALDDYEEGTFTPSFEYETPGTSSITFGIRSGTYTKIGRVVYFTTDVRIATFSKGTASGRLLVTGLPFAQRNTGGEDSARCTVQLYEWTFTTSPVIASVFTGTTGIELNRMVSNGVSVNIDDPKAGSIVWVTGFYFV